MQIFIILCKEYAKQYEDIIIESCDGEYQIIRDWLVNQWCSGILHNHLQNIEIPGLASRIQCPTSDSLVYITEGFDCTAHFTYTPQVISPCGGDLSTRAYVKSPLDAGQCETEYSEYEFYGFEADEKGALQIKDLSLGCHWIKVGTEGKCEKKSIFKSKETNAKAEALNRNLQRFINTNYGARKTDFFLFTVNKHFS